jgi:hypothetical protein
MHLLGQAPTFVLSPAVRQKQSCTGASRTVYFGKSLAPSSRIGTYNEAGAWFARSSFNYAAALAKCQALADWNGYVARRAQREAASKLRGRSITYYVDNTGVFNERMECGGAGRSDRFREE